MTDKRLELFKNFMKARVMMELKDNALKIHAGFDSNSNEIIVSQLMQCNFDRTADDILGSIEEYYNTFLTCKIKKDLP